MWFTFRMRVKGGVYFKLAGKSERDFLVWNSSARARVYLLDWIFTCMTEVPETLRSKYWLHILIKVVFEIFWNSLIPAQTSAKIGWIPKKKLIKCFHTCNTLAVFRSTVKGLKTQKAKKNFFQSFHGLRCLIFHLALQPARFSNRKDVTKILILLKYSSQRVVSLYKEFHYFSRLRQHRFSTFSTYE